MPNNLGQVVRCVSHVNTRLRYVLKSEETLGSPKQVVTIKVSTLQYRYVTNVSTDLNAPNGVFITNVTESGEGSVLMTEKGSVVNVT